MGVYNNAAVDNNFASDAEWRAWITEIQSAILASGFLIAASDTGQIDLATATRPAINSLGGFKMYKANDSLHATKPLFIKVEFGCGSATNRGKISITQSTATNGAGTQTGLVSSTSALMAATVDGSGVARVAGGGNAASMWFFHSDGSGASSQGCMLYISRSILRTTGAPTGDFAVVIFASSFTGFFGTTSFYLDWVGWTTLTPDSHITCRPDSGPNTGGDINTVYLFDAVFYRAATILTIPLVIGKTTELTYTDPPGSAFSISVWGQTRQFTLTPWSTYGTSAVGKPALLYEP